MQDRNAVRDQLVAASGFHRQDSDGLWVAGHGWYELRGRRGELKQTGQFRNLVTETGDRFYGDRAALILAATVAITAIATGTTAVVTTGTAHGFGVGDRVIIAGVTPAGYNGSWAITAVGSSTTFSIYVGTALGAGTAFGTAQGLTVAGASGMRLGTGTTAPAKTGAGAAIVTVGTGTNNSKAFDATFPSSALSGTARRITYKTTWAAGDATQNGLAEVVITTEQPLSQVAGTAANTISRALLSPVVNKGASDTLAVTWQHDLLGS